MFITDAGEDAEGLALVEVPRRPRAADAGLVFDPDRLEKTGAVRSSLFVYFEWFLPRQLRGEGASQPGIHPGAVDRGIISFGMG